VNLVGSGVGLLGASLTGMPVVGDLAGAGLGGLLGEAFNSGNASVMRRVGGMAANASKGADALDALQLQQQRRRQGLLGRAANIPQYLLPYAH
jgi:outer membrane lipoprotein SlyB